MTLHGRTEPVDLRVGTWRQAFSNQTALEGGVGIDSNLATKQQSRLSSTQNSFKVDSDLQTNGLV